MNYSILGTRQVLKSIINFSVFILMFFFIVKCQYIAPSFIDNRSIVYEINDTIFFDLSTNELLLDISDKQGMYELIKDDVDGFLIYKNHIYIRSNDEYFIYSNDTIVKVAKKNSKQIEVKPIMFYIDKN